MTKSSMSYHNKVAVKLLELIMEYIGTDEFQRRRNIATLGVDLELGEILCPLMLD